MIYTMRSELRSRRDVLRIGRQVEKWCRQNMGINGRKKFDVEITYYKSLDEDFDMGEYRYWDNEIIIYYNNCRTVENLIRTIIHEWQHQLQPMSKYDKMLDDVGYDNHPFEVEAEEAEEKYYRQVWVDIKPTINKIKYEQHNRRTRSKGTRSDNSIRECGSGPNEENQSNERRKAEVCS